MGTWHLVAGCGEVYSKHGRAAAWVSTCGETCLKDGIIALLIRPS